MRVRGRLADPASLSVSQKIDFRPPRQIPLAEDTGFYGHRGIDLRELPAALLTNWSRGAAARGASTITQQLAAESRPNYFVPLAGSGSTRSPLRGNLSSFPSVLGTGGSRTSSPDGGPGCSGSVGEWGFGCMARIPRVCGHCSQLLE